jgi:hypothetical protein
MRPWKQYLLLNAVAVVVAVGSIFVIPANTPVRVWTAVAGGMLATLNILLQRRLSKPNVSVLSSVVPIWVFSLLVAEGGWQQYVAYVGIVVVLLVGGVTWIAKKTIRET